MTLNFLERFFKFGSKGPTSPPPYILVERQINPELYVTGVKITGGPLDGMIFTTSPQVSFKEMPNGEIKLKYEYLVQVPAKDPIYSSNIDLIEKSVGNIIMDIVAKNHTTEDNANRESDTQCPGEGS